MQKDFPEYRHTDHLTIPTSRTRPHTPDTHNPQMKRKRKSRLSCCVARVPSAREARGLSTTKNPVHEAKETAPPSTKQKASLFAPVKRTLLTKPSRSQFTPLTLSVHSSPLTKLSRRTGFLQLLSNSNNFRKVCALLSARSSFDLFCWFFITWCLYDDPCKEL